MKMVFIKFKPDGKEYGFGVPEDYKGSAGLKPGSWVRVPVPGCRKKMLRVVVRVAETETPPEGLKMIGYSGRRLRRLQTKKPAAPHTRAASSTWQKRPKPKSGPCWAAGR